VIRHLGEVDGLTVGVGLGSLALVLLLKRLVPAVPASLVAVALGVAAVELFNLDDHGPS
jgi:SulP family sulfate permease